MCFLYADKLVQLSNLLIYRFYAINRAADLLCYRFGDTKIFIAANAMLFGGQMLCVAGRSFRKIRKSVIFGITIS